MTEMTLDPLNADELAELLGRIQPKYWRVLVMQLEPKQQTAAGIYLPDQAKDAEGYFGYIGKIVAMGGGAFAHPRLADEPAHPKVGDYVMYAHHSGMKVEYKRPGGGTVTLRFINDDNVLGVVTDPAAFKIYV